MLLVRFPQSGMFCDFIGSVFVCLSGYLSSPFQTVRERGESGSVSGISFTKVFISPTCIILYVNWENAVLQNPYHSTLATVCGFICKIFHVYLLSVFVFWVHCVVCVWFVNHWTGDHSKRQTTKDNLFLYVRFRKLASATFPSLTPTQVSSFFSLLNIYNSCLWVKNSVH